MITKKELNYQIISVAEAYGCIMDNRKLEECNRQERIILHYLLRAEEHMRVLAKMMEDGGVR